jgi:DNA-directed RNA polymerase specialized sigma24 family protein
MTMTAMCAENREGRNATDHAISRAFLTAHLLTANQRQAEGAVLEAIQHSDLEEDTEEAFLQRVACAAIQAEGEYSSSADQPVPAEWLVPVELQAVLDLSPRLRRCFVLRTLVGLSRQVCARLLHLNILAVDQYTCEALEYLPQRETPQCETWIPNLSYMESRTLV